MSGFFAALPPYLGGKRSLCSVIFRELNGVLPRRIWPSMRLLDAFSGACSVGLYAKAMGIDVTACDVAARASLVGEALLSNCSRRIDTPDVLQILRTRSGEKGPVESKYVPEVFTESVGRLLDSALHHAEQANSEEKRALIRLLALRVMLASHPMSDVRPGTIHRLATGEYESITPSCVKTYVEGLRLTRPERLWKLAQQINKGVFYGRARMLRADVLKVLPDLEADVAYFDPPYPGTTGYEKRYRVIDEIFEGTSRPPSPFSAKEGTALIDQLLDRAAHIPLWVLSLNNAVASLVELEEKMQRRGRQIRSVAIPYAHLASVARKETREANREFLVLGWDAAELRKRGLAA